MSSHPVLLDIDGTLVQSNLVHARAWSGAFSASGYTFSAEKILPLIGMGGDKMLATLTPGLHPEHGIGKNIGDERSRIFLRDYAPHLLPTQGARELLLELRARGCKLVIASSAKKDELDVLLRAAKVQDLIEEAATSDDAEASKPDPDIVEAALKKSGASAASAIMIGDTPYDILAAHAAHVRIIAVRCGGWKEPDIGDAEAVYDDPRDILQHLGKEPIARYFPSRQAH